MPQEKYDPQEISRRAREAAPPEVSDAEVVRRENARRFHEESARIKAEQDKQEQYQRDRQRAHEQLARQEDDAIRAKIFARYARMEEEAARAKAQAEALLTTLPPPRPSAELEAEQAAGRRALLKHAGRREPAAEEKTEATPGLKP